MTDLKEDHLMDASGLFCPEPVMMLHSKMDEISVGELLKVIATDPSTKRDITKFCNFLGHELLNYTEEEGNYIFFIRKG